MSSKLEKEIEEVKSLIFKGKLKEALKTTKDLLKRENLPKEVELRIIVLQSEIIGYLGQYAKALKLSEKVLKESERIDSSILKADACLVQAMAFYNVGKFKESYRVTKEGLEFIKDDEKFDIKQIAKTKVFLLLEEVTLELEFGNYPESKKLFDELYEFALKTKIDSLIGLVYGLLGHASIFVGDVVKGEEFVDRGLEILQSVGKHLFLIFFYLTYATVKQMVRKFDIALEFHQKGIDLSLETGAPILLWAFYTHSALIYASRYKLDKALEYNELALEISQTSNAVRYINTGAIYLLKNEVEKAYENFLKGLEDSKKTGHFRMQPGLLYQLVLSSLLLKNMDQAKKHLQELKDLSKESSFEQISMFIKLAEVLILKESTRLQDWFKAIEILESLLADEKLKKNTRHDAQFHLVEIRLKELQVTADKEVLVEVKKQIEIMQQYAEETQQFGLLANIYRLKSQLSLVDLDAEKAIALLITAKTLAEDRNLQSIASSVQEEQAKLEQQRSMWNRMTEQKAPLKETLKEIHIDTSAKRLAKETVLEVRDERTGDIVEYRKLFSLKI